MSVRTKMSDKNVRLRARSHQRPLRKEVLLEPYLACSLLYGDMGDIRHVDGVPHKMRSRTSIHTRYGIEL